MNRQEFYDITTWASEAPDAKQREFRQAVHTILAAIANDPRLKSTMVIKGGILLGVRYHSPRFTKDIDFSTTGNLATMSAEVVRSAFESSLVQIIEELDYDLDLQSPELQSESTESSRRELPEHRAEDRPCLQGEPEAQTTSKATIAQRGFHRFQPE